MINYTKKSLLLLFLLVIKTSILSAQADTSLLRDPKKYYLQINSLIKDSKGPDKADEKLIVKGAIIKIINMNKVFLD